MEGLFDEKGRSTSAILIFSLDFDSSHGCRSINVYQSMAKKTDHHPHRPNATIKF
jgi:hypothetical protein